MYFNAHLFIMFYYYCVFKKSAFKPLTIPRVSFPPLTDMVDSEAVADIERGEVRKVGGEETDGFARHRPTSSTHVQLSHRLHSL